MSGPLQRTEAAYCAPPALTPLLVDAWAAVVYSAVRLSFLASVVTIWPMQARGLDDLERVQGRSPGRKARIAGLAPLSPFAPPYQPASAPLGPPPADGPLS